MTKAELINTVAEKTVLTKTAAGDVVNVVLDTIVDELNAGNDVNLTGFGKFYVSDVAARAGRNPATGESLVIEAHKAPKFKFATNVKNAIR